MFSPLEQFDVICLFSIFWGKYAFPFVNILVPFCLILLFFIYFYISLRFSLKLVPMIIQHFYEILIEFIFNLVKQQIGISGYKYFPLIFCLFQFVLFLNLLSLIPFGIALTSHIIMIMWLSLSLCLSIFIIGLYIYNIQFLKIFIPQCPILLLPMLIFIEIFSYIIRSFSLAIRLSANIMAGHTLVFIISSSVLTITKMKFWFFIFGFCGLLAILFLELGVAFLQAYVFSVLICIYLNDALSGPTH